VSQNQQWSTWALEVFPQKVTNYERSEPNLDPGLPAETAAKILDQFSLDGFCAESLHPEELDDKLPLVLLH
jgi:hypothetical protein